MRLGIAHWPRAPEAHAENIEASHRRLYESIRPALRDASAPQSLWEGACILAVDTHNCRNVGGGVPRVTLFGSFPDLAPLAPSHSHVAAYDGQGNHRRFASCSVLARYMGLARDCGIGAIRVMVGRHTRVVRTWRYPAALSATVDTNTMRTDTPTHGSPPAGEISDRPPTGESSPPPALLPIAQRGQMRSATEACISTLEKEGLVIGEAKASHLYSAPWTIPTTYRPAGYQ